MIDPDAALVTGEDPGIDEDLEVVGDGRLGKVQRLGQLADARLAALRFNQDAVPCDKEWA